MRKQLVIFSLSLLWSSLIMGGSPVDYGQRFESPDKTLVATNLGSQLKIARVKSEEVLATVPVFPVEALRWTNDSRAIVTVEHIAGGSEAVLISQKENSWKREELDPPGGPYDQYEVVRLGEQSGKLLLSYKMRRRESQRPKFFMSSIERDLNSVGKGKKDVSEISRREFESLASDID